MKLKPKELCPIHHSRLCCGRETVFTPRKQQGRWEHVRTGVRRIKDRFADHQDGYRYKLSPAEMRKVLNKKILEQDGRCGICAEPMTDYRDVTPDHILPKGMNGGRSDDRAENIQACHSRCNSEKGSKRAA
jgi:5-methylcytosine-specific restriction endonuclease McrA